MHWPLVFSAAALAIATAAYTMARIQTGRVRRAIAAADASREKFEAARETCEAARARYEAACNDLGGQP